MSSDLANVRAEIKAWEHCFKETNGRQPTIDDIKKQPAVAQKYKLYKKLSKSAAASSSSVIQPSDPPSTPSRQTSSLSKASSNLLQSASRLIEATEPLAGFNPFSPRKREKGKQKEVPPSKLSKPTSNPFATPRKSKTKISQHDSFSPIESMQPTMSPQLSHEPLSVVSRARKRLRGEPVSPSPNKEKRRRVLSPTSLPFPRLQLQTSASDSDSDANGDEKFEHHDSNGGNASFVDDSPMKPTVTGKSFTYLFEEVVKPTRTTELFGSDIPTIKSRPGDKRQKGRIFGVQDDVFSDDSKTKKIIQKPSMKACSSIKSQSSALTTDVLSNLVQTTLPINNKSSDGGSKQSPRESHSSTELEYGQHDTIMTDGPAEKPSSDRVPSTLQLLPPSPDPNSSRPSGKSKSNGARSIQPSETTRRKKGKLQDGEYAMMDDMEDDADSSSDGFSAHRSVKLVHHSRGIRATLPEEEANFNIEDPILNYGRRVLPRVRGEQGDNFDVSNTPAEEDEGGDRNTASDDEKEDSTLHRNKMHRVLMVESLRSKQGEYEEEKIVRGLLSGRRVIHYDSRKGGEIWGVGEDDRDEFAEDGKQGSDEGADEWEGDPVPWEVGELSESHYHLEEL